MSVALDITELSREPRTSGVGEIEDERPACRETAREQLTVLSQLVLGVVRAVPPAGHGQRCDEAAVARVATDVEHGEEVGLR